MIQRRKQKRLESLEARHLMTQLADLDRDGDLDAYYQGDWFQNTNDEGDFTRQTVAANAILSAAADIDGDGNLDLVTAPLSWHKNNGQGQFTAQAIPEVGISQVNRFKFTDVGNDGRLDLIVFGNTELALLRNTDGLGAFSLELKTSATNVADAGDIDNDGDLDLLIMERGQFGRVSIDRNAGGKFARELLLENEQGPFGSRSTAAVLLMDMNGDRQLDLVHHGIFVWENFTSSQSLAWFPMDQATQDLPASTLVQTACGQGMDHTFGTFFLSDLDGDADVDSWCFSGQSREFESASAVLNNGTGIFTDGGSIRSQFFTSFELSFTDAGDVNGDGVIDYMSSNFVSSQPIWVDGATGRKHEVAKAVLFAESSVTFGAGNAYTDIKVADLDGDGTIEALVARGANLEIWQSSDAGAAVWSLRQTVATPSTIQRISVSHFDGNAGLDVVLSTLQGVRLMSNDGAGRLTLSANVLGTTTSNDLTVGDLDEDGDLDLLVSWAEGSASLQPWFNDGRGDFTAGRTFGNQGSSHVRLADFDADGDLDAFVMNENSKQSWTNDGAGAFNSSKSWGSIAPTVDVAVADLDRNDRLDFYVLNPNSPTDDVYFLLESTYPQPSPQQGLAVALGDVDNDGDYDAVVGTEQNQDSSVLLNDGTARFVVTRDRLTQARSVAVALGDADGDGDLDIFYANEGSVELFFNGTNPATPRTDLLPPLPAPRFDDHGNSNAFATDVAEPTNAQRLTIRGRIDMPGDLDVFTFPVVPGERYRIRSNVNAFVRAPNGRRVDDLVRGFFVAREFAGPDVDRVYVEVSGDVGPYSVIVEPEPNDHGINRDDATRISVPSSTQGLIKRADEEDWLRFTFQPGKTYDIRLHTAPGIYAAVSLFEGVGGSTANGQGNHQGFSRIIFKPEEVGFGPYLYPMVTCSCANLNYTLEVTELGKGEELPKGDVIGDANLDGVFDFRDLLNTFIYGQFEDAVEDNSEWWTGDWDGDRDFTTKDLVLAMQAGAYNRPAAVAAVAARERDPIAALGEIGAALDERDERDKLVP